MVSRLAATLLSALVVSLCWATGASAETLRQATKHQVVMRLTHPSQLTPTLQALRIHLGYKPKLIDQIPARPVYLVSVKRGDAVSAVDFLGQQEGVFFAERNELMLIDDGLLDPVTQAKGTSVYAIGPKIEWSEPDAVDELLRLDEAHGVTRGAGMRVAVLDTGSDLNHPAFTGTVNPANFPASGQRDFIEGDLDPTEGGPAIIDLINYGNPSNVGHGTHVTGIVHRIAPDASLLVGRILNQDGEGTTWLTAKAMFWAADPNANGNAANDGAHVINLSLATKVDTMVLRLATDVVTCHDVPGSNTGWGVDRTRCAIGGGTPFQSVVVAAAGNDASPTLLQYPAAYDIPGLIAVAASDNNPGFIRKHAYFSNSGTFVDVAAPGYGISSQFFDNWYAHISGTSMAAPMVSGLAALVQATGLRSAASVVNTIKNNAVVMCEPSTFKHIDVAVTVGAAVSPLGACEPPALGTTKTRH